MVQTRLAVASANRRRTPLAVQHVVSCAEFAQGCGGGLPLLAARFAWSHGLAPAACLPYRAAGAPPCPAATSLAGPCAPRRVVADYGCVALSD
jgi:cathepsin C